VHANVVDQPRIVAGHGQAYVLLRSQHVEPGSIQKLSVGSQHIQVVERQVGRHRHAALHFGDLGIDEGLPFLACHRHSMVAINHKVSIAHLVELHRRKRDAGHVGRVNAQPLVLRVLLRRQEDAVEIAAAPQAADDLVERHGLDAAIPLIDQPEGLAQVFEGDQVVVLAGDLRPDASHRCLALSLAEIVARSMQASVGTAHCRCTSIPLSTNCLQSIAYAPGGTNQRHGPR